MMANIALKESISYCDDIENVHPYMPDDVTLLKSTQIIEKSEALKRVMS